MAKRQIIEYMDDIDGTEAIGTTTFALNGKNYEIDLSQANTDEFVALMEKYIKAGRQDTSVMTVTRNNVTPIRQKYGTGPVRKNTAHIREWLRANGTNISDRGRIPKDQVARYDAAHDAAGNEIRRTAPAAPAAPAAPSTSPFTAAATATGKPDKPATGTAKKTTTPKKTDAA